MGISSPNFKKKKESWIFLKNFVGFQVPLTPQVILIPKWYIWGWHILPPFTLRVHDD